MASTNVYTAIPSGAPFESHVQELKATEPLLLDDDVDASSLRHLLESPTYNWAGGFLTGVVLSITGFHCVLQIMSSTALTNLQIVMFSGIWSSSTYLIAYTIFSLVHCTSGSQDIKNNNAKLVERLECYFAVGVFCGFCTACVGTDVTYRLPIAQTLWTIAVAAMWVSVMLVCSYYNNNTEIDDRQHNDDGLRDMEQPLLGVEKPGKRLAFVVV
jgi:hypothetical protein